MFGKKKREVALATVPSGKKLAIISVHDYPNALYSAYWEIGVSNAAPFYWRAKIICRDDHIELQSAQGEGGSENEARLLSQTYVKSNIEAYKRPLKVV